MQHHNNQTSLFLYRVGDFMSSLPPILSEDTSCLVAVEQMRQSSARELLVEDSGGFVAGILLSTDLLQHMTSSDNPAAKITTIIRKPIPTVCEDEPLFRALFLMRHWHLKYLPVVDAKKRPTGMLQLENFLDPLLGKQMPWVESIGNEEKTGDLRRARNSQAELVSVLLEQQVPAGEILAVLTRLNDEVYGRVLERSMQTLAEQGWGDPPVAFAVMVTGSAGRWESLLGPDQDNGFILADYPDRDYRHVNNYFYQLAESMTRQLDEAGIPLCIGQIMASNHAWRKRFSEWQTQMLGWLHKPSVASATLFDIWIDFRCVFGDYRLVDRLRNCLTEQAPRHHGFFQELEALQFDHEVAITPLRTLKRENRPGEYGHRKIDIKRKGIRPLVEGVRILALRKGNGATETLARLAFLRECNGLSLDLADALEDAFQFLNGLLLKNQLKDYQQGKHPEVYVAPGALQGQEKAQLKASLRTVSRLRSMVHTEFTAELF
jgi:signal-transduction protein with cAMP-binding, CBS, and nucleotidyltransferase domain